MSGTADRRDHGDRVDLRGSELHGPTLGTGTQHNYFGGFRPPAELPHQVGVIPPRAGSFQDRAEAARLRATLTTGSATLNGSEGQVLSSGVLTGMGGVGKTQLAADTARAAWQAGVLDVLVWITAATAAEAVAGYTQAGVELLGAEPEYAAQAFLARLEHHPARRPWRWLIVLDDVADPADLAGLWPPASPHGSTLVTTRRKDAALVSGRRLIEIGLFTPDEALAYLTTALAAHDRTEPAPQMIALADALGHLPLALSQATAYLIDTGITCTDYSTLLAGRTARLVDASPDTLPDDQTDTVAAAWTMSIERANSLSPAGLARPLLQLVAFLDPNGIPDTVLTSSPARTYLTATAGRDQVTPDQVRCALRALHRLSLIDHTPITFQTVRIHQLIQRAVRDALTSEQHNRLASTAADALLAAWPTLENNSALSQTLRANTTALAAHAEDALLVPKLHGVLFMAGRSLGEAGQVTAAHDYFHHLTHTMTTRFGPDHPHTLTTRHQLARWRGEAGDAAGAATACATLLTDQLRVLGPDHPHTLTTRHDLALWQGEAGDAAGAAASLAGLLADRLRVLGDDHPDTLTTRHHAARWQGRAGDPAGAVEALTDLLPDQLRVLGQDHPSTLTTRGYLAYWRGAAGDATGAVEALTDLLPDQLRVLGQDHPDTLVTQGNLAQWRGKAGDAAGAASSLSDLLEHKLRVLGPDHPHTLATRELLAYWREQADQ